jgi:hypothetical protein
MTDRYYPRSWSRRGVVRQQSAQEATLAREQANQAVVESVTLPLKEEKGKRQTITLHDGSLVEADLAICAWDLLKEFAKEEPAAFRWLLAQAQGRTVDAEAQCFPDALEKSSFINEDRTIEDVTRAVILNSHTSEIDAPMIGALRLKGAADKAVLEEMQTQLHQDYSEGSARARRTGGWLDQLWEKMQREGRQGGQSID